MAKVINRNLNFRNTPRSLPKGDVQYLVLHHMAHPSWDVQQVHNYHRNGNNWAGIGYHLWVDFEGNIYKGRELSWQGTHVAGFNARSIGIGCQGNFQTQQMPDAQVKGVIEAIKIVHDYLGRKPSLVGHGDIASTACPGRNFRMADIKAGLDGKSVPTKQASKPSAPSTPPANRDTKAVTPELHLPASAESWRIYRPNGPYTAGGSGEVGSLSPAKFGGLRYEIVGSPMKDVYLIETRDFGTVAIYAGANTSARVTNAPQPSASTSNNSGGQLRVGQTVTVPAGRLYGTGQAQSPSGNSQVTAVIETINTNWRNPVRLVSTNNRNAYVGFARPSDLGGTTSNNSGSGNRNNNTLRKGDAVRASRLFTTSGASSPSRNSAINGFVDTVNNNWRNQVRLVRTRNGSDYIGFARRGDVTKR